MFCSVKKNSTKDGDTYRFYLCERYRDKQTGKVKSSDKFIISLQHDDIVDYHMVRAIDKKIIRACKEKGFDKDIYSDLVFDKFLDIKDKLQEIEEDRKKEEYQKSWKQQEQYRQYYSSGNTTSSQNIYTDKQKEYLKKIYRAAAVKLHPDIIKDDGGGMRFLNDLKEKWGIWENGDYIYGVPQIWGRGIYEDLKLALAIKDEWDKLIEALT